MNHRTNDQRKPAVPDVFDVLDGSHREIVANLEKLRALLVAVATPRIGEQTCGRVRNQARELVAFFSGPVREHNYDEERHVFPTLLACDDDEVRHAAEILCEDHAWIELSWLDIESELVNVADGHPVADAEALAIAAHTLASILHEHMALEESLLYPELRGRLKAAARRSISVRMASRRPARTHPAI